MSVGGTISCAGSLITLLILSAGLTPEETEVSRQSYAGLLWSKQFYHYIIKDWLTGDPEMPTPPNDRLNGRNSEAEWRQLFNRDVVSMPDKWEYPWVGFDTFLVKRTDCLLRLPFSRRSKLQRFWMKTKNTFLAAKFCGTVLAPCSLNV